MFEKEAEERYYKNYPVTLNIGEEERYKEVTNIWKDGAEFGYNKVKEELEEERKLNAEIKARFVKCNTCTDEMKSKCLMFTENLCEGERCEELIDIVSLVNKSDLERKIEALEKANEWHYVKDGDLPSTEFGRADVTVVYINAYENPCKLDCCFDGTNFIYWDDRKPVGWKKADIFGKIYAWKYPEKLPELPKENE